VQVDLNATVEDVGAMMAFQAAGKDLELIVHVHPDVPERVIGDPQRIRQCLINLLGNAIKFTARGEVDVEVYTHATRDEHAVIHFEVRDTGIGIAEATLPSLFEPFVQADSSTTRHYGGTGLGLSIVRRLVETMGGEIGVESRPGQGSRFWFRLPLRVAQWQSTDSDVDLSRIGRRILVVDDNASHRRMLELQLRNAGYDVMLAARGSEALQSLQQAARAQDPFDLLICDYQLEDMDGPSLGAQVSCDSELSTTRMLVLAPLDRHDELQCDDARGFAACLRKPVRARELLDSVSRILSSDPCDAPSQTQRSTRSTQGDLRLPQRYHGRVLLVEDNVVNQKVATRHLEKLGCNVTLAHNGVIGVEVFAREEFDLVLMDLQMPMMDGLTATLRIREMESVTGRHTPVVALTANAMAGQVERCLEVGMDGFLAKPIEIARLCEMLERVGLTGAHEAAATGATPAAASIHLARLQELVGGDTDFGRDLVLTFSVSCEQILTEIWNALAAVDRAGLARAAHKLRGASANIHAAALLELSQELEQACAVESPDRLQTIVARLADEFRRTEALLQQTYLVRSQAVGNVTR
jgi:CheY-like chemotaxis protein